MPPAELDPREAARQALRAGLPLAGDRLDAVTATARHIQSVVAVLRELDLTGVAPATAGAEVRDAAL
ncbi:hypothetical protein RB200_22230 [Streptomyces sp. PmtG]